MQACISVLQCADRQGVQAPCFVDLKTFHTEVKDGQVLVDLSMPAQSVLITPARRIPPLGAHIVVGHAELLPAVRARCPDKARSAARRAHGLGARLASSR